MPLSISLPSQRKKYPSLLAKANPPSTCVHDVILSSGTFFNYVVVMNKAMVFPMVMYACDSWTVRKAERQRIDASELWCWRRLLEIQPVHSEGDQPWDFFGRNDAKAETPVLWPPHAKS